jgi:hypothetical protein
MIAVRVIITEKTDGTPPVLLSQSRSPAGQVTIPFPIHNRFGLQPGMEVETDIGRIGT